jgi:hypothetical protein
MTPARNASDEPLAATKPLENLTAHRTATLRALAVTHHRHSDSPPHTPLSLPVLSSLRLQAVRMAPAQQLAPFDPHSSRRRATV